MRERLREWLRLWRAVTAPCVVCGKRIGTNDKCEACNVYWADVRQW